MLYSILYPLKSKRVLATILITCEKLLRLYDINKQFFFSSSQYTTIHYGWKVTTESADVCKAKREDSDFNQ